MDKTRFDQLDSFTQKRRCFIPQHVSVTKNPDDETFEQIVQRQNTFLELPEKIRFKLSSPETGKEIEEIGKKYNLDILKTAGIARTIRNYYFKEINLENFSLSLEKETGIDAKTAQEMTSLIVQKIINGNQREEDRKNPISTTKMPVSEAMKIYPTVGEQLISKNHIKLKIFPEPVRPSVKNWITDYTENFGYDRHSSVQRGEYIFKSENGKNLDSEDRQKVSEILKSFDESTGLEIDTQQKRIVFQKSSPEKTSSPQPLPKESSPRFQYVLAKNSDTKFHNDFPNQISLKKEELPKEKQLFSKNPPGGNFTVNLKKPLRILPATDSLRSEKKDEHSKDTQF